MREFAKLLQSYGYHVALYGHFAQGCIHCRINFDLTTDDGLAVYRAFTRAAADLVVSMGGSLSGEHGDGQARGELLERMYSDEILQAFREFKAIWDPLNRMNPGKVVEAESRSSHLRLQTGPASWEPETRFRFEQDGGRFGHATSRCVGVGKCRRVEGGTMCPSYMATREEKDSTRGRAHLLFEMVRGDFLRERWEQDAVKESLDTCLSCKGCLSDCPVSVDIATYKAEFLSHYYSGRRRPREQYAFGWIHRWAPLGSSAPGLANWATHAPGISVLAKWMANMAPEREIPHFATQTFRDWFEKRSPPNPNGPPVLLWPDTFNDHFHPQTLIAATRVLEHLGYRVSVPKQRLCCGRALYDHGMLDEAERLWQQVLSTLDAEIRMETPIIGVEPSCVAAFRDELVKLRGEDGPPGRLSRQVRTLNEFVADDRRFLPPRLEKKILWQPHCHQKATAGLSVDERLFRDMGLEVNRPNDTCCGMAGAFGFERSKYALSQAVGERKLFPALREVSDDTELVADGFSCREQVRQITGRLPLHTAELLALGLGLGNPPEVKQRSGGLLATRVLFATVTFSLLALGYTLW